MEGAGAALRRGGAGGLDRGERRGRAEGLPAPHRHRQALPDKAAAPRHGADRGHGRWRDLDRGRRPAAAAEEHADRAQPPRAPRNRGPARMPPLPDPARLDGAGARGLPPRPGRPGRASRSTSSSPGRSRTRPRAACSSSTAATRASRRCSARSTPPTPSPTPSSSPSCCTGEGGGATAPRSPPPCRGA